MRKLISIIVFTFLSVTLLQVPTELQAVPLSKLKNRILYSEPPITIVYTGGIPIIVSPEPEVIGWQSYCGFAFSTCDSSKEMIVLDAVDGVFR